VLIARDLDLVPFQHAKQVCEDFWVAVGYAWWEQGGRSEETSLREAGEYFGGRGEEGVEAEGEVVGFVAGGGREEVAGDLEGDRSDCDIDWGGEELGGQAGDYS
jgi:hypothetical protein